MTVLAFPGHHWAHCTREDCTGCHLCHGGLAICTRCGGMEGSLPTDCPGERMSSEREEAVYEGAIDFVRDKGWIEQTSKYSPGAAGLLR